MSIAIYYGSSNGNTEAAARLIAAELGITGQCHDIATASPADLAAHSCLILGTSTWGVGDLQDDWEAFLRKLGDQRFDGVTVALFGLGDSASYADSFVDGLDDLAEAFSKRGATLIGRWPTEGYDFSDSRAVGVDGQFVGLALDADNEDDQTADRCARWVERLRPQLPN